MNGEELKKIINAAADLAARRAVNSLKKSGKIKHNNCTSFQKTVELLTLYPKLPDTNDVKKRIEAALNTIRDDEYYGVIESHYFDGMTILEISEIYDCKYQNISKKRNKLVNLLAKELFPEDVANEILQQ